MFFMCKRFDNPSEVNIDHDDAEYATGLRVVNGSPRSNNRAIPLIPSLFAIDVDARKINFLTSQLDRVLEVPTISLGLQLVFWNQNRF